MSDPAAKTAAAEQPMPPAVPAGPRPWPAVIRYLLAIILGAAVAGLTSYLLRKIGL